MSKAEQLSHSMRGIIGEAGRRITRIFRTDRPIQTLTPPVIENSGIFNRKIGRRSLLRGTVALAALAAASTIPENRTSLASQDASPSGQTPPKPERKVASGEALVSSNPLEFTYPGPDGQPLRRTWEIDNAGFGIPPNEGDRMMGTIYDINDSTGKVINEIQAYQKLYQETNLGRGVPVMFEGQLADTITGRGYLATVVEVNRVGFLALEFIPDLNNPTDYLKRQLYRLNVGGSIGNAIESFTLASDEKGKYLELVKKQSVDPKDNGKYILRLDSSGIPVGDWTRPVENPLKYRIFAPTTSN